MSRLDEDRRKILNVRGRVPYCVVISPNGDFAAFYNRKYEITDDEVRGAVRVGRIVGVAERFHTGKKVGFGLTLEGQEPYWMKPEMIDACVVYFLWSDGKDVEYMEKLFREWREIGG